MPPVAWFDMKVTETVFVNEPPRPLNTPPPCATPAAPPAPPVPPPPSSAIGTVNTLGTVATEAGHGVASHASRLAEAADRRIARERAGCPAQ